MILPSFAKDLTPTYRACLVIDADDERSQRLARLLSLLDYRPFVMSTLSEALERMLRDSFHPHVLLLGQAALRHHPLFASLLRRVEQQTGRELPRLLIQTPVPEVVPVYLDPAARSTHVLSPRCLQLLYTVEKLVPPHRTRVRMTRPNLVLDTLPTLGLFPRVAQSTRSRNRHMLQMLTAAHTLIGEAGWQPLLRDVGLAQYQRVSEWPPDDDDDAIPTNYLSLLHQAVAFSHSENAAHRLRQWGAVALQPYRPPVLTLQALKLLSQEQVLRVILEGLTRQMNDLRGESLHVWCQQPGGTYWLVHYSNLYAYGRIARVRRPACQVWLAAIERILHLVGLEQTWEVYERECSCLTLTGHCVFEIKPKPAEMKG
jgi:hypothetical protein